MHFICYWLCINTYTAKLVYIIFKGVMGEKKKDGKKEEYFSF